MKSKKSEKTLETLKTIAICLLFLCAVALSALYFYRSGFIFSQKITGGANADTNTDAIDQSSRFDGLILPETIAVKSAGEHTYAITQGDGYMRLIYRLFCRNISVALSRGCTSQSAENADWIDACAEDEFLLVKYHSPLSYAVIYADASSELGEDALKNGLETDIGAIDQMFIFPHKTKKGDIFAVTRGQDGKIFNMILNESIDPDNTVTAGDFDIYVNVSAMTLADLYCHVGQRKDVICSTVLHSHGLNAQRISFTQGYAGIVEDTALSNTVATFFDINPDKSGNYYDEKTMSTVYVATHGSLHIGEKSISYSCTGNTGGIPLSNYSDAFAKNGIDTAEAIVLSQIFISGYQDLDRRFLGGDAHPVLSAVYSDSNGRVTLEYIYCYSNVEIEDAGVACRLTLKNGKIVEFESSNHVYNVSEKGERQQSFLPEWILNMSLPDNEDNLYSLKYRYRASDMFAEWTAVKVN